MLAKYVGDDHETWDEYLALIRFAINISSTDATGGHSPYLIAYGREPMLALDIQLQKPDKITKTVDTEIEDIILKVTTLDKIVKDNIDKNKILMKKYFDKHSTEPNYKIGDLVWLYIFVQPKHLNSKLKTPYAGPFRIIATENFNFKLRRLSDNKIMPVPVHANRILPVYNKAIRPPIPPFTPTQMSVDNEQLLTDNIILSDINDDDKTDHTSLNNPAGLLSQGLELPKLKSSAHNDDDDASGIPNLFNTPYEIDNQMVNTQITTADNKDQAPSSNKKPDSSQSTSINIDTQTIQTKPKLSEIIDSQRPIHSIPKARLINKTTYYYIIYDDQQNKKVGQYISENDLSKDEHKYIAENKNKIIFLRSKPKAMNDMYMINTNKQHSSIAVC
jgi:heat shock protein HspQ